MSNNSQKEFIPCKYRTQAILESVMKFHYPPSFMVPLQDFLIWLTDISRMSALKWVLCLVPTCNEEGSGISIAVDQAVWINVERGEERSNVSFVIVDDWELGPRLSLGRTEESRGRSCVSDLDEEEEELDSRIWVPFSPCRLRKEGHDETKKSGWLEWSVMVFG